MDSGRAPDDAVLVITAWVHPGDPPSVWARLRWGSQSGQVTERQFVAAGAEETLAAVNDWVVGNVRPWLDGLLEKV